MFPKLVVSPPLSYSSLSTADSVQQQTSLDGILVTDLFKAFYHPLIFSFIVNIINSIVVVALTTTWTDSDPKLLKTLIACLQCLFIVSLLLTHIMEITSLSRTYKTTIRSVNLAIATFLLILAVILLCAKVLHTS